MPDTIDIILHYHTVCYFFVVFCFFVPYTNTKCGGGHGYIGMLRHEGEGNVRMR